MGSWSVYCQISQISITSGQECVLLPLKKSLDSESMTWKPATLPIFGEYNDYGGIENIKEDDNTKLIEEHFGITIDEFAEFLVDGKYFYDRKEAKQIAKKMKNNTECKDWQFMWIDKKVYDFMCINHDEYSKGKMDYGNEEMLKSFGFKLIEQSSEFQNYDPKRFNQLWKKGDVEFFSDGEYLLNKDNNFVYHFGKGCEQSLESYFDVPKELEHLKEKTELEAWRLFGNKIKNKMSFILSDNMHNEEVYEIISLLSGNKDKFLYKKYYSDLNSFGDRIVHLINMRNNMYSMSKCFSPHKLYITPQCGEYKMHQIMLNKFSEINKEYFDANEE